jgi:hypothetical protein
MAHEHFTLNEFVSSVKAAELGIDNTLPATLQDNALTTLEMLERIRFRLSEIAGHDVPINLDSGYRCPALNIAVGGQPNSDHMRAQAADWVAPTFGTPYQIALVLAPLVSELGIGQLIYECPRGIWVHTSTRVPDRPENRIITINRHGTFAGILED